MARYARTRAQTAGMAQLLCCCMSPSIDEHGRPEPEPAADEITSVLGFLDYQRATLAWKCAGLGAAGLAATVASSSMTLGGVIKHMAYVEACSRSLVDEALSKGGLDQLAQRTWDSGEAPSLRWIALHMIEEYARHNGHADLLRESVDGETGE